MKIEVNNLSYIYNMGNPFEKKALDDVSFKIGEKEFIGLIGHTGSGKSTLVQQLNGLVSPSSGSIIIDGEDITRKDINKISIRQKVGLVFQYPEYQLFEETIYKDIAFGPKNLDLPDEEIHKRVMKSMELVGLDYEEFKDRSPFDLSGGQKRRVAIAGVLAMEPKVLILDEPTAGLDPHGRDEILGEISNLYKREDISIILVSHSMEDVAKLVNRILVMHRGKLVMDNNPREIFKRSKELEEMGLGVPQVTKFMQIYKSMGHDIDDNVLTVEEAKIELLKYLRSKK